MDGAPSAGGNAIGRMTGLTMLTPIRPQWLLFLRIGFFGARFFPLAQRAILQFDFIHYVRWAIVDELHGERLRYRYGGARSLRAARRGVDAARAGGVRGRV